MKRTGTNSYHSLKRIIYRLSIAGYVIYLAFSPGAFALQAEAPETGFLLHEDALLRAPQLSPLALQTDQERVAREREEAQRREEVRKIRHYFNRYHLPLAKYAEEFVESAHRYGIDWRLLPAIGFIESTGGKFACGNGSHNAFGWHSCKKHFRSYRESIDFISKNLAGKYPKTARYYRGKSVRGILEAYNPPSVVPDYADKVMHQMDIISRM